MASAVPELPATRGWTDRARGDSTPAGLPLGWMHAGIVLVASAYSLVTVSSFIAHGLTRNHLLEPVTAMVSWLALLVFRLGRVRLSGAIVVSATWIELTWSMHASPHAGYTSLGIYVLLIVCTGLVLGGRAALLVAGVSWILAPIASATSGRPSLGFGAAVTTNDAVQIWIIFVVQTGVAALLVRVALLSWSEAAAIRDASRIRYERLFASAEEGLVSLDREGRVVASNPAASRLLSLAPEALAGAKLDEVLQQMATDASVSGKLENLLQSASALGLDTQAGHRIFVEITNRRPPDSAASESLVVLREVTPRILAERKEAALTERLNQAQRVETVGRLAGTVAHDFNNILTAVSGCASLLADHGDPEVRTLSAEIEHAADQGAALTRQLLAFSRRDRVSPEIQDVSRIVREAEPLLRRLLGDRHQLVVDAEEGARALVDRGQMQQVLVNLVANAREAMTESGTVHLRVLAAGDSESIGRQVLLEIADSGGGMGPEVQDRIFEPFFTTKPNGRGTGLGLATVQGIVETWNGAISVDTAPGRGSIFRIAIPGKDPAESGSEATSVALPALGHDEAILVVEDEEAVRRLISRVLERAGFRVVVVERPEHAAAIAAEEQVDFLLTDVQMPGLTGPQVRVLVEQRRPGIPVLYISGWIEPSQAGQLGPDVNVLLKPFHPDALVRRIRSLLDARREGDGGRS
jgi:two-component system cell cycle sensor histidine kinase/response regulator CckA